MPAEAFHALPRPVIAVQTAEPSTPRAEVSRVSAAYSALIASVLIVLVLAIVWWMLARRRLRWLRSGGRKSPKVVPDPWQESARRLRLPADGGADEDTVDLDPSDVDPDHPGRPDGGVGGGSRA